MIAWSTPIVCRCNRVKFNAIETNQWVQKSFQTRQKLREEMHVYYPEDRILDLVFMPLPMLPDSNASMLIFIHDITPLRKLEKMRSEFVANVSHELKTPIAAIRGFAETLLAGAMHDEETAESFLRVIMEESERLNRLINEILEISRMESKRIPLLFSWTSIDEVVNRSMDVIENVARSKRITFEKPIINELFAEIDEDRIKQVLINLLSNAVNYTHDGGKVHVEVREMMDLHRRKWILISVADNGIGMHQNELGRIFERFYRIDKARSRSSGGTGLGLSIVKHIVELHHGKIEVESRIGRGSQFTIWLPETQHFSVPHANETERVPL